jgi:hypothetical protein
MVNPKTLEEAFVEFSRNLAKWAPDGVVNVDLKLLNEMGLLQNSVVEEITDESQLSQYFHIIETPEKVTLFNDQFAIWIVPELVDDIPTTTTYISLLHAEKPHLEIVYTTCGVYNTPKYILMVLQHYLKDVQDNEKAISNLEKP